MKRHPTAYIEAATEVSALKSAQSGESNEIPRYGVSSGAVPGIHGGFRTGFQNSAGGLDQQGRTGFPSQSVQHVQ
jgi:hypothetical protein